MNGDNCDSPLWIACRRASHWPVIAGLLTSGWTASISRIPLSVACSALPSRTMYSRVISVSMIAARVAGVPSPQSFMARESSLSSSDLPAVSIAVSKVASLNRFWGRVCFSCMTTSRTGWGAFLARPAGRACSSASVSFLRAGMSSTFHPGWTTAVPTVWKRSMMGTMPEAVLERAEDSGWPAIWGDTTAVMTVVTAEIWSSCHAISSRRQTRS